MARTQLKRIHSEHHSAQVVQNKLDPFLVKRHAFEHIDQYCPISQRIYFPQYYGVMTLDCANYPVRYRLQPQAVVLEALKPKTASRRVLSAEIPAALKTDVKEIYRKLKAFSLLTDFEIDWYCSLFSDRLRQVAALHEIGITHGDIRDDHFRIPGDFYDIALYDFSASYTFTFSRPYMANLNIHRSS